MSEFMHENDVNMKEEAMADTTNVTAAVLPPLAADKKLKKKKSSGPFGIFRAALYMLRKKPDEKEAKKAANKQKGKDWKMIVEAMRPLHLPETPQSPMQSPPMFPPMSPWADELISPASPAASSSCGTLSQYASAQNLQDLYNSDDEEGDPDEVFDALTGDEMIDAKAEEFIAQFYKQIQLQNTSHYDQDRGV